MRYVVSAKDAGKTVKELLSGQLGLSKAFIKHLKFLENGIMLDGERVTVRKVLSEGDILTLALEDESTPEHLTPVNIPLDIVYEDEYIILPNKPPFMPTHPSHLHHGDTLADALAYRYSKSGTPFVFRPVNRLDRNTSGITLIAKDRISAARLTEAMKSNKISKQYVAILEGELTENEGVIETYMKRTAESIIVRQNCAEGEGGDYALTQYYVLARAKGYTLILALPKTGRTHQLRVHFAGLGCPIVGDELYGKESPLISRHALHALSLSLPHPISRERLTLTAPLPKDMDSLVGELFDMSCADLLKCVSDLTEQ